MAQNKQSEKSVYLDRDENIQKGQISAKKVAIYTYDANTDTLNPGVTVATSSSQTITKDTFGSLIMGSRYNQVEIDYSTTDPDSITDITVTKTVGGDASNSGGQAVFTSGTNTSGGIKAVTNTSITYRPHAESYVAFTAIFTSGIANSYQRIGLYDTNNGFFIGFEGTSFGVTKRSGATDTRVVQASFSVDTLTGDSTSLYTRNGTPEVADFTKDNLFRIRFGWLGAAPILFEILSPDGDWVTFHKFKHPNTTNTPSIQNPNLPITLDIQKTTAGATALVMNTACWAAGTTSDKQKITDTLTDNTLASLNRSVITGRSSTGGGTYVNAKVTPSGSLTTAIGDISGVVGQQTKANSLPVTIASDQSIGGGTEYAEGATAATATGSVIMGKNGTTVKAAQTDASGNIRVDLSQTSANSTAIKVDGSAVTQPISGTVTANTGLTQPLTDTQLRATAVPVSGTFWQATQPVSGTVTANAGTNLNTSALALDATLTGGTQKTKLVDSAGTNVATVSAAGAVKVDGSAVTQPVSGTVTANAGTGTMAVSAASLPLPSGAATSAKQPALGTAGTASSDVLTVQGITSMTPLKVDGSGVTQPVSGTFWQATQPVSGTVTANAGTGNFTVTQSTASNLKVDLSGTAANATAINISDASPDLTASISIAALNGTSGSITTLNGQGTYVFQLTGTWTGTVQVQITADGTNWLNITDSFAINSHTLGTFLSGGNITANGIYQVDCSGLSGVRLIATAFTSGPITGTARASRSDALTAIEGQTNVVQPTAASLNATVVQSTAANLNATVTQQTITKGTQGTTGVTTQDLKDAGRTSIMVTASVASTATAETLISVNKSSGLAATTAASSNTITTGKKFRIQSIIASARNSTGTVTSNVTIRLRAAVAGATTATSPIQFSSTVNLPASAASTLFPPILIPDGFEIDSNSATNTWGITITHPQWVTGTQVATFDIALIGYEY